MPWLRVDDRMYCNRKVLRASLSGKCFWMWAMDFSADQLTDGILEPSELQILAAMLQIADWETVACELVQCGLFEPLPDGRYQIHDYLKYNPSRADVLKEREATSKRQAGWLARHPERKATTEVVVNNGVHNKVDNGVHNSAPYPYPYPNNNNHASSNDDAAEIEAIAQEFERTTQERLSSRRKSNGYPAEFERFWAVYPRQTEKSKAFRSWKARLREGVKPEEPIRAAVNYARYCLDRRKDIEYIKYPSSFLSKDRPYEEYLTTATPEQANAPPEIITEREQRRREMIDEETRRARERIASAGGDPK